MVLRGKRQWRAAASLSLVMGLAAACTGSERQLFPPQRTRPPAVDAGTDAGSTDASTVTPDTGLPPDDEDSGVVVIGLDLDPDVDFEWPETKPGSAGACEPGTYTGAFECDTQSATGTGRLVGTIQVTLERSTSSAKRLVIASGRMSGYAGGSNELFSSSLGGELSCGDATLDAETIKSSVYPFPGFGEDLTSSEIMATLDGRFDAEALAIEGDAVVSSDSGFHCAGPFTLRASR
jgi:hypothetical protein